MSTGKAKVIVKVGNDFFRIAENIFKMFKGSKDVLKSSQKAATDAGRTIKNASQSKIKDQARLSRADKADVARRGLKTADDKTKNIDLKSRYLKNGKPSGAAGSRTTSGTGSRTTSGTGSRTSGTGGKKTDKYPWSTRKPKTKTTPEPPKATQAQKLRDADVSKGTKINLKNAASDNIAMRGAKRLGEVITKGGKKFIKTKTGKLIAIGGGLAGVHYIGKAIDKSIAGTNGAATTSSGAATTTKPKPPISGRPLGPPQRKPTYKKKLPKLDSAGAGLTTTEDEADRPNVAKPKTLEQKLKAKFVKFRGGEPAFGKKGSDAAWKTEVLNMREGSEGGYTYTDQQNYDKIIAERKELASASKGATKKKRGGVIKRNKGGPVRGVGKALRGYGNNSIYSNKMY